MNIGKGLGILAVASMLLTSPAWAEHMNGASVPDDTPSARIGDNGGSISDDSAALPRDAWGGERGDRIGAAPRDPAESVFEGRVAAIDRESGTLLLSTDAGLLRLQAAPEDVQHLRVGDLIEVALLEEQ